MTGQLPNYGGKIHQQPDAKLFYMQNETIYKNQDPPAPGGKDPPRLPYQNRRCYSVNISQKSQGLPEILGKGPARTIFSKHEETPAKAENTRTRPQEQPQQLNCSRKIRTGEQIQRQEPGPKHPYKNALAPSAGPAKIRESIYHPATGNR